MQRHICHFSLQPKHFIKKPFSIIINKLNRVGIVYIFQNRANRTVMAVQKMFSMQRKRMEQVRPFLANYINRITYIVLKFNFVLMMVMMMIGHERTRFFLSYNVHSPYLSHEYLYQHVTYDFVYYKESKRNKLGFLA